MLLDQAFASMAMIRERGNGVVATVDSSRVFLGDVQITDAHEAD
jgi:hypothetical protein